MRPGMSDRYRDSVSSGNSYYTNPYREDVDYRKAERARALHQASVDRLETTQQKIERELIEKFLAKKGKIGVNSIALLAALSKLIFTGIMLPPYIIFYVMPKLVFKKLSFFIKKFTQISNIYLNKLISLKIHLALKKIITLPFDRVLQLYIKGKEITQDVTKKAKEKLVTPMIKFFSFQFKKLQDAIQTFFHAFTPYINGISKFFKKIQSNVSQQFEKLKNLIPSLSFRIPTERFKELFAKLKWIKIDWDGPFDYMKKKSQEILLSAQTFLHSSWIFLWQPFSQIKLPHYKLLQFAKIQNMYKNFLNSLYRVVNPISSAMKQGRQLLHSGLRKVAKFLKPYKDGILSKSQKVLSFLSNKVARYFKKQQEGSKKWKQKWQHAKNRFSSAMLATMSSFKAFPSSFLTRFYALLKLLSLIFNNIFFAIRIFYAVICLFFKFLKQAIQEKMIEEFKNS